MIKFSNSRRAQAFVFLFLLGLADLAWAEDTRKKWQFGLGLSYWSTEDSVRSNAGTAYAPVDPSQGGNLPPIKFSDPRPDANENQEASIEDSFKFDFSANYGLTRWFALEIGLSYYKGDVGDFEIYMEENTVPITLSLRPPPNNPSSPFCENLAAKCYDISTQDPIFQVYNTRFPVGTVTEVPVTLSGLVRFRPESPFDPYVGGGVGYIFTNLDTSGAAMNNPIILSSTNSEGIVQPVNLQSFEDLQKFTNALEVTTVQSGARGIQTFPDVTAGLIGTKLLAPVSATLEDGIAWHLQGGVDYYFNERWSLYINGKYVWATSQVKVRIDDQNQVLATIPDFGCETSSPSCTTASGQVVLMADDPDPDGPADIFPNDSVDNVTDLLLIQGGDIKLGGFSLGFGIKFTF